MSTVHAKKKCPDIPSVLLFFLVFFSTSYSTTHSTVPSGARTILWSVNGSCKEVSVSKAEACYMAQRE